MDGKEGAEAEVMSLEEETFEVKLLAEDFGGERVFCKLWRGVDSVALGRRPT